jgi:glucan phosphoethanolaminetransferase (alkaline phosphatase superfamily)
LDTNDARYRLLGPAFLIFALVGPNALYLSDLLAEPSPGIDGALFATRVVLLVIGLTLLLVSGAFMLYRWTFARRLVHVALFFILLDVFYRVAYHGPVSPGLLLAVPQTSQLETLELLAGHPTLTLTLSLVALLAALALAAAWRTDIRPSSASCLKVGAAGLALVVIAGMSGRIAFGTKGSCCAPLLAKAVGVFPLDLAVSFGAVARDSFRSRDEANSRAAFSFPNPHLLNAASRQAREVYVIVVGETSRRQNWSLFGYPRHTNPDLEKIVGELVPYRMMSNATNTVLSLPMALTRATPATRDRIRSEKSIVTLLKQAGFETFWISNQEKPALPSNPIYKIAIEADHVSFRGNSADRFDTNLLDRLDVAMTQMPEGGKAVIFLHMEGSHFSYEERYPPQFARFVNAKNLPTHLSDRQRQLIDQYDNTVVFTDYVLARVIGRLSSCDCAAGMMYFSDHGERLFDRGSSDSDFGHGFPGIARQEIEIPFVAWLSPKYQQTNPSLAFRLRVNARWVAELHDLFETIVDLTGVDYDNRSSTLSLFSAGWQRPVEVSVLSMDDKTVLLPVG